MQTFFQDVLQGDVRDICDMALGFFELPSIVYGLNGGGSEMN